MIQTIKDPHTGVIYERPEGGYPPGLSACMIVKDEEKNLPRCLDSITNIADEIIIVDTGSTDNTVHIAENRYGARVLHSPWREDFSRHRNESMEKAGYEWILIIDADEYLAQEDIPTIRGAIAKVDDSVDIIMVDCFNVYTEKKIPRSHHRSARILRNGRGIIYTGAVHNNIVEYPHFTKEYHPIRIFHTGYDMTDEERAIKTERLGKMLDKALKEDPNNAFQHINYCQFIRTKKNKLNPEAAPEIIEHADIAMKNIDKQDPHKQHLISMAMNNMGWAYYSVGKFFDAITCGLEAYENDRNFLDAIILIGFSYAQRVRYCDHENAIMKFRDRAKEWIGLYLAKQEEYQKDPHTFCNIPLQHINVRPEALKMLFNMEKFVRDGIDLFDKPGEEDA
jgi:glycosyltransferase involved in cell wall biosynthesis